MISAHTMPEGVIAATPVRRVPAGAALHEHAGA